MASELHEARWWRPLGNGKLVCTLCPRLCEIPDGKAGFCFIRKNVGGRLVNLGYGKSTGFAVDPIEKKPLNHFLPGTPVLSFGTAGCNLGCKFCQNWDISKARIDDKRSEEGSPEEVVELALRSGCAAIAYTYNDPVIWAEYAIDVARAARQAGLKNVFVTAGYVTPEARPEVYRYMDAANVDLKAFSEDFYRHVTLSHLEPVKDTLVWLRHETDVWFEITTLLIPGLNDSDAEIAEECAWIVSALGRDVPIHFTAFHPDFKMRDRPPTPPATVLRAREIARRAGCRYVYVGNVHEHEGQTTFCPECGSALIRRDWHAILAYRLNGDRCPDCGHAIPGVFRHGDHSSDELRTRGARWRVSLEAKENW
ncbi:MAG: AmmeMemoRadiSam system radical SAM enzyme [Candidatus Binatia bacterium]